VPGFFATLKGALSDLPRNEPISDELDFVAGFNERVRRLRAIVDSARPQIARMVTALAESAMEEPFSVAQIHAWREAANARAARDAGFAYQGYVRLKLDSVRSYVASLIASICDLREQSPEARALEAIVEAWAERRGIVYSEDAVTPDGREAGTRGRPATSSERVRVVQGGSRTIRRDRFKAARVAVDGRASGTRVRAGRHAPRRLVPRNPSGLLSCHWPWRESSPSNLCRRRGPRFAFVCERSAPGGSRVPLGGTKGGDDA